MKRLLQISSGVGVVLLVLVVAAYFLPRRYMIERSITIQAPPATVWALVGDLRAWREWHAWYERDPAMTVQYSVQPTPAVIGGWVEWASEELGGGRIVIQQSHPPTHLRYELTRPDRGSVSVGEIRLSPTADGLVVSWMDTGDFGFDPAQRWMGLGLDRWSGPDFEAGLHNLKSRAEASR